MNKAIIVAVTSLILVGCGWFLANKAVSNRKIRIGVYALFFCITLACAITVRNIQADFPDAKLMAAILKFCASAPSLLLAIRGFLMEKNRFDLRIVIALALCLMADVIINFSLVAEGSVFAIAHMIFTITFIINFRIIIIYRVIYEYTTNYICITCPDCTYTVCSVIYKNTVSNIILGT